MHGSETWPVRKANDVALQVPEMRMVTWMYDVKLKNRFPTIAAKREIWNR